MPFWRPQVIVRAMLQNWAEAKHLRRENLLIAIMCSSLIDNEYENNLQKALCVADMVAEQS